MITKVLDEYGACVLPLTSEDARRLVAAVDGRLTVSPAPHGGYVVKARQHVGAVALPGLRLLIRPKVPMENVFLLLGAGIPPEAWRPERYDFATSADVLASFAAFYARTCEATLRGGLLRKYRTLAERLPTIRGRIDIVAQIRRPGMESPVACRFDEYTDDVAENRVVKAALERLLRIVGLDMDLRRALRREHARFADVAAGVPDLAMMERLYYDRLNRHYQPLVVLSVLVLRNVTLRDAPGEAGASAFLLDMNYLFQRFVTQRLRAVLAGRLDVDAEPLVHLGARRAVAMQPISSSAPEGPRCTSET